MKKDNNKKIDSLTAGFGISASAAIVFNTLLVWAKETIPSLFTWMKALTSHHWITHGLLVVAVFIVLGILLTSIKIQVRTKIMTRILVLSVAFGGIGIMAWYLLV